MVKGASSAASSSSAASAAAAAAAAAQDREIRSLRDRLARTSLALEAMAVVADHEGNRRPQREAEKAEERLRRAVIKKEEEMGKIFCQFDVSALSIEFSSPHHFCT